MDMKRFLKICFILVVFSPLIYAVFIREKAPEPVPEPEVFDETRIGEMVLLGFRGTEVNEDSEIIRKINNLNLGGVILFDYDVPSSSLGRNITDPGQLKALTENLKKYANHPIFIATDAEGGVVNRLKEKYGFLDIPSAEDVAKGSLEDAEKTYLSLADELSSFGINVNFAPVVDVNVNPENPVIGNIGRSFSENPETVSKFAEIFINAHEEAGVITAIKHFPGHGSSKGDTHLGMVDITETYEEKELIPFKEIIQKGIVRMVMTAHVMNKWIDSSFPATLSPEFIKGILRGELGYQGVVVSDDMHMGAIMEEFGFEDAIVRAINAGVDMVIVSNNVGFYDENAGKKAVEAIRNAVEEGRISKERIEEAVGRIRALKSGFLR